MTNRKELIALAVAATSGAVGYLYVTTKDKEYDGDVYKNMSGIIEDGKDNKCINKNNQDLKKERPDRQEVDKLIVDIVYLDGKPLIARKK